MASWLDGKTAVITGAGSGIGKALSELLIKEHGCEIVGTGRHAEKLGAVKEGLGALGEHFMYETFDVSDLASWQAFAEKLSGKGIIPGIVINNAGMLPKFDKFTNYSYEEIHRVFDTNFFSCVYSMKTMLPLLMKSKMPAVINISSSAALAPLVGTAMYSASKGAVKNLTEAVREELAGKVYVGLVCPGFTKTDIMKEQKDVPEGKIVELVSMSSHKMARKIINGMKKRRKRMVIGLDAVFMDVFSRYFGVSSYGLYRKAMKASRLKLFSDIFTE